MLDCTVLFDHLFYVLKFYGHIMLGKIVKNVLYFNILSNARKLHLGSSMYSIILVPIFIEYAFMRILPL